ncbi:hypothetical protein ATY81_08215 [Rhizobium sp. R72]|uniref:hypothetical protein n=1 Tax=unclassified Rhizobium TaxID=2613769 RepID=UPI000B53425A|nr:MULTISPECIES: hypothetical protein [unclassified Rhizobium]OWV97410.1 hypothetical protein ATY81_08215 [Rhizobium sp. R72]OWV97749.1 hypothetical protein ATY80_08215 [Rhizobium sp. R711]
MSVAFYRDYVADLKARIDDLHANTDRYQTYELTMELLAQKNLVSYTEKKAKGQTEGLSYRRDFTTGQAVQMQQQNAYALFSGFFNLGQFLAFTGQGRQPDAKQFAELLTDNWRYPTCAVYLTFRQKGQPKTPSMRMHFVGLNGQADAAAYERKADRADNLVAQRPFSSAVFWEWK